MHCFRAPCMYIYIYIYTWRHTSIPLKTSSTSCFHTCKVVELRSLLFPRFVGVFSLEFPAVLTIMASERDICFFYTYTLLWNVIFSTWKKYDVVTSAKPYVILVAELELKISFDAMVHCYTVFNAVVLYWLYAICVGDVISQAGHTNQLLFNI